jgi:tRNA-Thr(GGU) m(6)t(6)A37 methyltransferase TsaA
MFKIEPIAFVSNSRNEITDDYWGDVISKIILTDDFKEDALYGLKDFSHAEIIFSFHKADSTLTGAEYPRNNPVFPLTGIFAQRRKNRPNKIGTTIVKIIDVKGNTLTVGGLDAINGTPVLDIKPILKEFLPAEGIKQPEWSTELMKNYWKKSNEQQS